jgi:hypothetical protein
MDTVFFSPLSLPRSVPGFVDDPPPLLFFFKSCISATALSISSIIRSLSSSSYSRFIKAFSFSSASTSFLLMSSYLFFMCIRFFLVAFSLKRMLTYGKFNRSSTLGLSLGSFFSIQRIVRVSSLEYTSLLIGKGSLSAILTAKASSLSALKAGYRAAISYKMQPKLHISLFSLYYLP